MRHGKPSIRRNLLLQRRAVADGSALLVPAPRAWSRIGSTRSVGGTLRELDETAAEGHDLELWRAMVLAIPLGVALAAFIALSGVAGPELQASARDLLATPLEAARDARDALARVDWTYGLWRSF